MDAYDVNGEMTMGGCGGLVFVMPSIVSSGMMNSGPLPPYSAVVVMPDGVSVVVRKRIVRGKEWGLAFTARRMR